MLSSTAAKLDYVWFINLALIKDMAMNEKSSGLYGYGHHIPR
jgi:hypothetical protein